MHILKDVSTDHKTITIIDLKNIYIYVKMVVFLLKMDSASMQNIG